MNIEDKSIPLTLREQSEEWYDKEWENMNMNEEDELQAMREYAHKLAGELCGHLDCMQAAKATIPISNSFSGRKYLVTVEQLEPCEDCGQVDDGTVFGEYPCKTCGCPMLHGDTTNKENIISKLEKGGGK